MDRQCSPENAHLAASPIKVATEDDAETSAFAHCRTNPDHCMTCTRSAHFHPGSIPVIVFSTESH